MSQDNDLRHKLHRFANSLAAEQWHDSGTYELSTEDRINAGVARCKADIGQALLEILGPPPPHLPGDENCPSNCKEHW